MYTVMPRKTSAASLDRKLPELDHGERWLYQANKLTNGAYHKSMGISSTIIKAMADERVSDNYVYQKYVKRCLPRKETPALVIGQATHKYILEHKDFDNEFAVFAGARKAGTEWKEFIAEHDGKGILKTAEMDIIKAMRISVMKNDEFRHALKAGFPEVSVYWRCDITDMICKARADLLTEDCIWDIKTVTDCSPYAFNYEMRKYGYDIQAAYYMLGFQIPKFRFVCIEKEPPYQVAIYELNEEWVEVAHLRAADALERFKVCYEKGQWKGFTDPQNPVMKLTPPKSYAAKYLGA